MMKTLLIALLFLLASVLPALAADAPKESAYDRVIRTGTLRCGYSAWPPYFSLDPNTKILTGVNKDLSDIAVKMLGLKIEYVDVVLGADVEDLKSGKIDAMCGAGPWLLATIKFVDYSKPYFFVAEYVYGRADEKRFTIPADMDAQNVTFSAIDADTSTDLALSLFPKAKLNSLGNVTDPSQMLLNVATHKADAVITDPVTISVFNKNNPGKVKSLFKNPLAVVGGGFEVKKGEQELLNMLNGVVDAAINTGQVQRTLNKYDPTGILFLPISQPYETPRKM